jgi:hypothetical protein
MPIALLTELPCLRVAACYNDSTPTALRAAECVAGGAAANQRLEGRAMSAAFQWLE